MVFRMQGGLAIVRRAVARVPASGFVTKGYPETSHASQ